MAQLSMPYRIALVGLLVVAALWFTVLKPKDPAPEPATSAAPGVTGLAGSTDAANGAVGAANGSAAASQSAANAAGEASAPAGTATPPTGAATPSSSSSAPAAKGASAARVASDDPSAPLLRALDRKRAVVLLFSDRRGADDAAVRDAVNGVDRRGGRAVVKTAAIRDVGRYQAITRGVRVVTSPTVLVISPGRTARAITGLTTTGELDQAVGDVLTAARKKR